MLQQKIDQNIKAAMLSKNEISLRSLRAIKAALLVAKTEKGASDILSEEAEIKVLQKLVKQRRESADIYKAQNRNDLYQIEVDELQVIETYLPKQLNRDEINAEVQEIIVASGASGIKDMGKIIGMANKQLAGKADGKTISEIVKKLLS